MTQLDHLPTAVLTHPDQDGPRLLQARALDEQCDPLGEFIRVQVQLARLGDDDPRLYELERRQQELLAEFEQEWAADLVGRVDWWVFRRGYVEEIALSAAQFLEHASGLFERFPIQEVHLQDVAGDLRALAASPYLGRAHHLDLSNNRVGDAGASLLARSPHVAGVRSLNLSSSGIGDAGAAALAHSPHLDALRELYLSNSRIGAAGARALAATPRLASIQRLFLDCNHIGAGDEQLLRRRFGSRVRLR